VPVCDPLMRRHYAVTATGENEKLKKVGKWTWLLWL